MKKRYISDDRKPVNTSRGINHNIEMAGVCLPRFNFHLPVLEIRIVEIGDEQDENIAPIPSSSFPTLDRHLNNRHWS